jgi:hypothetical protein
VRGTAEEAERLAAALRAAVPKLPRRTVSDWSDGMARVRAAGRTPRPEDYWSTRESALEELAEWIAESEGLVVELRGQRAS